jgi:hypothetical protein
VCSEQTFVDTFLVPHYFDALKLIFLLKNKISYVYIVSQAGYSNSLQSRGTGKPQLSEMFSTCISSLLMATTVALSGKTWVEESTHWRKFQGKRLKLAGVIGHSLRNPINSHVETTQRSLHKLGKLKSFNMKFSLVIEEASSFRMSGRTTWDLIPKLKCPRQKKKSMLIC